MLTVSHLLNEYDVSSEITGNIKSNDLPSGTVTSDVIDQAGVIGLGIVGTIAALLLIKKGYMSLRDMRQKNEQRKLLGLDQLEIPKKKKKNLITILKSKLGRKKFMSDPYDRYNTKHSAIDMTIDADYGGYL